MPVLGAIKTALPCLANLKHEPIKIDEIVAVFRGIQTYGIPFLGLHRQSVTSPNPGPTAL